MTVTATTFPRARVRPQAYRHPSVRRRIEACLRDHVGEVVTREQLDAVAVCPATGQRRENWHQRLSELRTDAGYTILSHRDRPGQLRVGEYVLANLERRPTAGVRTRPSAATWQAVLDRDGHRCAWDDGGEACGLADGDEDPVGGGTVRLTDDHTTPHSHQPRASADDPDQWRVLCGRHQVVKRNYWDSATGKLDVVAILQAASREDKERAWAFLTEALGR